MDTDAKETTNKGNIINIGLVNNNAQANTDITTNVKLNNSLKIKTGIIPLFKSILGSKTYKFIGEYEYQKAKYEYELEQRINAIPEENIVNPRISVAGPVLESLKYNLNEEQIKEMYTNILISEIDRTKQNKVLPAYIEIIKQISRDDALFIKTLKDINKSSLSLCFIKLKEKNSISYIDVDIIIVESLKNNSFHTIKPQKIVLENLERLNIIKIKDGIYLPDEEKTIDSAFEYYKSHLINNNSNRELIYTKGILEITDFGLNFIEICCS